MKPNTFTFRATVTVTLTIWVTTGFPNNIQQIQYQQWKMSMTMCEKVHNNNIFLKEYHITRWFLPTRKKKIIHNETRKRVYSWLLKHTNPCYLPIFFSYKCSLRSSSKQSHNNLTIGTTFSSDSLRLLILGTQESRNNK